MAIVTEKDGSETIGGIAGVRDAFNVAGQGRAICSLCVMKYGEKDEQWLTLVGTFDGNAFRIEQRVSPGGALAPAARAVAREMIEGKSA